MMKTILHEQRLIVLLIKLLLFYRPSGLAVFFRRAKFPEHTELTQLILKASRPEEHNINIAASRARQFKMILDEFGGLARWQQIFCNYRSQHKNEGNIIVILRHWPELKRRWQRYYQQESFLPSQIAGFSPTNISNEILYPDRRLALEAVEKISKIIYEYMLEY